MSDTPRQRLMELADDLLQRLESNLSELVLEPELKIDQHELDGFAAGMAAVDNFISSAYPRASIESSITGFYWDGLRSGTYADHGERVLARYRKARHAVRILQATYGPQAG